MTTPTPLEQAQQRTEAAVRPSWKLQPAATPTRSQLGGLPDGPIGGDWPLWEGKPQHFLARIDLGELHAANGPDWLPDSGSLLFFYDQEAMVTGFDPMDRGGWAVRYLPPEATGTVAIPDDLPPFPDPEKRRQPFTALPVTFVPVPSWPSPDRIDIRDLLANRKDRKKWQDRYDNGTGIIHRIGGYPDPIQNDDMEEECQLASMGVKPYSKDPREAVLLPGAKDWRLLLQLDSDDALGWMWGDVGRLYFWIREQDARAGNFAYCWLSFQCC